MNHKIIITGCLLFQFLTSTESHDFVKGQLIAKFIPELTKEEISENLINSGFSPERLLFKQLNIWLVKVNSTKFKNTEFALTVLRKFPFIIYAQLDHKVSEREFPDDEEFENMWHHHNTGQSGGVEDADVDSPEAWDITTGGTSPLGHRIVVAIIDGGFQWNHQDLIDNAWVNQHEIPDNGIDDDENGYIDDINGWDAYDSNGIIPVASHGTKVAGMIGAVGNNNLDVAGINWDVDLMFIAGSSSSTSTITVAYGYALDNKLLWQDTDGVLGANVVATNSSFGINYADCNSNPYPVWNDLYNSLGEAGILSAAATMNINANVDEQGDVPTGCSSEYMIAVTNTTKDDIKFSSAAFGLESIDLGAPGTSVCSTSPTNQTSCSLTGTSYSSPVVAGAVAMVHSGGSELLAQEFISNPAETALLIKEILLDTVDPLSSLNGITVSGGRLNLFNAVYAASQYDGICSIPGDFNDDSEINIQDIVLLVSCILNFDCLVDENPCKDLNEDSIINIYDIIILVNLIIGG